MTDQAEAVAPTQGVGVNQLITDGLHNESDRVRQNADFRSRVKRLVLEALRYIDSRTTP